LWSDASLREARFTSFGFLKAHFSAICSNMAALARTGLLCLAPSVGLVSKHLVTKSQEFTLGFRQWAALSGENDQGFLGNTVTETARPPHAGSAAKALA